MLKSLDIIIGNNGNTFLIKQFYTNYPKLFNDKKIYHINLNDLYPEHKNISFIHDDWLMNNKIDFSEILNKISEYIERNDAEQVLVLLDITFIEQSLTNVLKNVLNLVHQFSKANITLTINLFNNPDYNFNPSLLVLNKTNRHAFDSPVVTKFSFSRNNDGLFYKKILEKMLNLPVIINTYTDEKNYLTNYLKQLKLSFNDTSILPTINFSKEVIAYLLALHVYHKIEDCYYFFHELEFLTYKSPSSSSVEKTRRIQFNDAKILSEKLSSNCRQTLLKDITLADIPYMPDSSKSVYLSLMLAEKQVQLEEIKPLLPYEAQQVEILDKNYPLVTVYTTSYNNAKYLKKCIESVAAQETKYPFIHLISDDNSPDDSQKLLTEYAKKYPHIRLILRKQNSIQANYYGIFNNLATKYVAVCDSDDFYTERNKLEKQVNFLEENPDCGLCFHSAYMYYEDKNCITGIYPNGIKGFTPKKFFYLSNIITLNLMQSSSVMYRWKWVNGLTDEFPFACSPYDWALNIMHAHKAKIGFINEPLSLYRRHSKAAYASTEVNVNKHLITYCYSELKFSKILNEYTERKYENLFLVRIFEVLHNFYTGINTVDFDKNEYNIIKSQIEKDFPEYIQYYKDNLANYLKQ